MEDIICTNCGNINDYRVEEKANNHVAFCNGCGKFIKNIPHSEKPPQFYFGKYKGKLISDFSTPEELQYLDWALNNINMSVSLAKAVTTQLDKYE